MNISQNTGLVLITSLSLFHSFTLQGDSVGYFRIVFTDDDSIPVNTRVHYKLHGDVMDLFHPDCAMYENEHNGGLKQTVFGCSK